MFESTKAKIEWVERQISDLEVGFGAFLHAGYCTWESTVETADGKLAIAASCHEQVPLDQTLLLGEVIHNLRTTLDHAAEELIGIDTKTDDIRMIFPAAAKQADYVARCREIKTRRDDTKAFFINLAAYPEGAGKILYALDQLDATGKLAGLIPIVGVAKIGPVKVLNPDGSLASTATSMECSMEIDGRTRLVNLGTGMSAVIDKSVKPTFDMFFGDVGQFKFQRVIPTLRMLAIAVKDTVKRFERFVNTRF